MNSSFSYSGPHHEVNSQRQLSPQKQQWALINQYKALQYERLKQKQRLLAQQKREKFRRQLDNQLNSKNNVQQQQIEADRKYYEFITQQANQLKERQEKQKFDKYIKRRQAQQQNARNLQRAKNSRIKDNDTGYHLDIGHKSQQERRMNTLNIKRNVMDTLDYQVKKKHEERQRKFYTDRETDLKNLQYQLDYFEKRSDQNKNFGQNQRVYQYYQDLERQKRTKDMELEHRLVDEAAYKKRLLQDERIRNQQLKKFRIKEEVKETLDQQVKQHNLKRFEQSKINPEQYSYGVISNVFRERQASYDKNKYIEELRQQAEEQKRKKKMENYMSEEQYKLNLNQLNKVVNGQYVHNGYLDRSMGTIGDSKQLKLADIRDHINDKDAQLVKQKLDNLKKNSNSALSRTDRSL